MRAKLQHKRSERSSFYRVSSVETVVSVILPLLGFREMHVVLQEDLTAYSTPDGQQPIASASFTFEASDWTEVVNESTGTSAPEEF